MTIHGRFGARRIARCIVAATLAGQTIGAVHEPVWTMVKKEKPAVLETMRELVAFESGSKEFEELERINAYIAERLGGRVEWVEPSDVHRMADAPAKIALKTGAPVVEGFGLMGFGAHSAEAEYVLVSSIEPRLYLAVRLIIDIAQDTAPLP